MAISGALYGYPIEIYAPQSEAQPTQNDKVNETNEADIIDDDNQETQTIRKCR